MINLLQILDKNLFALRAQLGAKWCLILFLLPVSLLGIFSYGMNALVLTMISILVCMSSSIVVRKLSNHDFEIIHPGSIITGLLIALTVSADLPIYMIILGACFGEIIGKIPMKGLNRNLLNPAILGRTLIAFFETFFPYLDVNSSNHANQFDLVSGASVLFKDSGGILRPELYDALIYRNGGAIGECSSLLLVILALFLFRYIIIKRDACLNYIFWVPIFVVLMPSEASVVGHAPWVSNPLIFLFGSSTLLTAIFFASDPKTIPNTKLGCIVFGIFAAMISVAGRLYTSIPGFEMYAILIMNILSPKLDEIFQTTKQSPTKLSDLWQLFHYKILSKVFPKLVPAVASGIVLDVDFDHVVSNEKIAKQVNIDKYLFKVNPIEKADYISKLKNEGKKVIMF
ncbi:RnfABCDGE type electron transport complex subunit D, partial [bacterium]|nr:RnfABCDGE type electron transport complex subunit D [bacterium]